MGGMQLIRPVSPIYLIPPPNCEMVERLTKMTFSTPKTL